MKSSQLLKPLTRSGVPLMACVLCSQLLILTVRGQEESQAVQDPPPVSAVYPAPVTTVGPSTIQQESFETYRITDGETTMLPSPTPYVSATEMCPPGPPTCTSCADADACVCGKEGPLRRYWRYRMKPCLQESHWGYCEYFDEPPFGASLRQTMQTQVVAGLKDQLALFQFDFEPVGTPAQAKLSQRGQERLARIAEILQTVPAPLFIEQTPGHPQLDATRRDYVRAELAKREIPLPEDLVIVQPIRGGMSGLEATLIYRNLLDQTSRRGSILSTGTASGASAASMPERQ